MNKIINLLIWLIEKDLDEVKKESLSEEAYDGLLSQMWENPAFRNYIKDRNEKIVHTIAGIAGSEPEPRDKTRLLHGQRVENLVLGAKARASFNKLLRQRKAKVEKSVG